jgi:hypothetical protein
MGAAKEKGGAMSAKTESLVLRRRAVGNPAWMMLGLAAVLAAAVLVAVHSFGSSSKAPAGQGTAITAELRDIYSGQAVTGTGPDLATFAALRAAEPDSLPAVTGTGPGLVWIAGHSDPSPPPAVTGTGPDLVRIAGG